MTNEEAKALVDLAVQCWHAVANEHAHPGCNCFRAMFAGAMREHFDVPQYGEPNKMAPH